VILYLDASALVKCYVAEAGSPEVRRLIGEAQFVGTAAISRAEVAAALAKAVRVGWLPHDEASAALAAFREQWVDLVRLQLGEGVLGRAEALAWEQGLRGHDAVHLAAALFWQEVIGERVTLACYDRGLWIAGSKTGLALWPEGPAWSARAGAPGS